MRRSKHLLLALPLLSLLLALPVSAPRAQQDQQNGHGEEHHGGPPPGGGGAPHGGPPHGGPAMAPGAPHGPGPGAPQFAHGPGPGPGGPMHTAMPHGMLPNGHYDPAYRLHNGFAVGAFQGGHFHGRTFATFTPHEHDLWVHGYWHDYWCWNGSCGWWFVADGIWYLFDAPVYPYPTYVPAVVYIPEIETAPPTIVVAPSPPPPPPPPPPVVAQPIAPPAQSWYYCDAARAYYPYVSSCPTGWRQVPATQ